MATATDPSTARIRPATSGDLDAMVDIQWAVGAEGRWIGTEVPFDRDGHRALSAATLARADAAIFVADASPGVVGQIWVIRAPFGVAEFGMALLDGWRGRGLGTGLLRAATDWAIDAGAHKMSLEVWPHNEPAIGLYRRAGYVEEGRRHRHYRRRNGELWDSLIMGRPLP